MKLKLFSEVYNCYFLVVRRILEEASHQPLSEKDLYRIADTWGYGESALAIVPKLVNGEWNLLSDSGNGYRSKTNTPVPLPLTHLQKSWLKALFEDARFRLFFSDEECQKLNQILGHISPLFKQEDFIYFDRYADGDDFSLDSYREHFRTILAGIRDNRILTIDYFSAKNSLSVHRYLPCRIEYSAKDDKFRLFAILQKKDGSPGSLTILNLSRIMQVRDTGQCGETRPDIDACLERSLCEEPVVLEISKERNALERTMLHFACYRKQTEKIGDSGKYLCRIYYSKDVETELLIQVLSFGPVVKVLGPEGFLKQIQERVGRQRRLLDSSVKKYEYD